MQSVAKDRWEWIKLTVKAILITHPEGLTEGEVLQRLLVQPASSKYMGSVRVGYQRTLVRRALRMVGASSVWRFRSRSVVHVVRKEGTTS